eukprot:1987480-Pleurochrysis_carterae.AAC.1
MGMTNASRSPTEPASAESAVMRSQLLLRAHHRDHSHHELQVVRLVEIKRRVGLGAAQVSDDFLIRRKGRN